MKLDWAFSRKYDENSYNCAHFVAEIWLFLTGFDIKPYLLPEKYNFAMVGSHFKSLECPQSPCLTLFKRKGESHVGIFIKDKILHLNEKGVHFVPLKIASFGYSKVRFYSCQNQ